MVLFFCVLDDLWDVRGSSSGIAGGSTGRGGTQKYGSRTSAGSSLLILHRIERSVESESVLRRTRFAPRASISSDAYRRDVSEGETRSMAVPGRGGLRKSGLLGRFRKEDTGSGICLRHSLITFGMGGIVGSIMFLSKTGCYRLSDGLR